MRLPGAVLIPGAVWPHAHNRNRQTQLYSELESVGGLGRRISRYLQTLTAGFLKKLLKMHQVFLSLPAPNIISLLSGFSQSKPVCLQSPVSPRR